MRVALDSRIDDGHFQNRNFDHKVHFSAFALRTIIVK